MARVHSHLHVQHTLSHTRQQQQQQQQQRCPHYSHTHACTHAHSRTQSHTRTLNPFFFFFRFLNNYCGKTTQNYTATKVYGSTKHNACASMLAVLCLFRATVLHGEPLPHQFSLRLHAEPDDPVAPAFPPGRRFQPSL